MQEVIATAERVTGRRVTAIDAPRRAGDPARLMADSALARRKLGWQPQFSDFDAFVGHAWKWEQRLR